MPTGASSERSERCSGMRWSRLSGLFRWCCVVVFCESCLLRSWSLVARPFSSLFVAPASCLQYPCGFSFCLHGFKTGKDTWAALVVVGSFLWFSPLPAATHLNKSYALLVDLVRSVFPRRIALRCSRKERACKPRRSPPNGAASISWLFLALLIADMRVEQAAEAYGKPEEDVAKATTENAMRFFKL
eukprot:2784018-Rhodomonas_salina.1